MTNKEAIARITQNIGAALFHAAISHDEEVLQDTRLDVEAFKMAIKALENERPKGHWLDRNGERTGDQYDVVCSECTNWSEYASDFCMNCGARMIEDDGSDALDTAAKALTAQDLTEPNNNLEGWVPCGERMPSEDGHYLVTLDFDYGRAIEMGWLLGGEWVNENSHVTIAWQPLPEAYKGGK